MASESEFNEIEVNAEEDAGENVKRGWTQIEYLVNAFSTNEQIDAFYSSSNQYYISE